MRKSVIELKFEEKIRMRLSGKPLEVFEYLVSNPEIQALQEYANIVSIKRLGFNDHGPVHMRKAALNSILMFDLLKKAKIKLNLEKEGVGCAEDSKISVMTAALLHDIGMTVSRDKHEFMSVNLGIPIINTMLEQFYHSDIVKKVILRSTILECIFGHMATQSINTLEAGLVLIGDGCDLEQGRARITTMLSDKPRVGDIHKYSSTGIDKVHISEGDKRPIKIRVDMSESVGFFQVEEVLFPKIASSPVKKYIELHAGVKKKEYKKYL
ncbi:MAG: phosphohydrolase [Candidatus Cloacimonetes bacterium]|nr:phosphohydrolase [Candidatus Cloacimonadota bacterium]MCF7814700.1 phosphohydrolase [Candidatus Cloacimonadota bacterium]MCF7868179.1 phosphohydrolase [Candidatus Cloacimonadota bacterium]MCF7884469.1 phosphohydrolase [Candidatus Cloacimonadota bacterium]